VAAAVFCNYFLLVDAESQRLLPLIVKIWTLVSFRFQRKFNLLLDTKKAHTLSFRHVVAWPGSLRFFLYIIMWLIALSSPPCGSCGFLFVVSSLFDPRPQSSQFIMFLPS
jgi:hypothetical protein